MSREAVTTEREHFASATLDRIRAFLAGDRPPSPCLVMDLDAVAARYADLSTMLDHVRIRYAVKANPSPAVVRLLVDRGACFDVAGVGEINLCLRHGAAPSALSYGNPVKKPADIAWAFSQGVREFVFDAIGDLENIARHARSSRVLCRLAVEAPASATPFGRKFGCSETDAVAMMSRAAELGLDPAGVCFHVGSQQLDPGAWDGAISMAAQVFRACAARGVELREVNLGGGFAVDYSERAPSLAEYAAGITASVQRHFPSAKPELTVEPGRALVAAAGVIRTEVVLIAQRSATDPRRWVYLDVGRYNGLAETENEAIAYRIVPVADLPGPAGPVILAGPTCDGDDVLYQRTPCHLPRSLSAGDELDILSAGAYTASYASVEFNGFPPLRTYCLSGGRLVDVG